MKNLKDLAKQFPNDQDFGREIRNLINSNKKPVVFLHGEKKTSIGKTTKIRINEPL